MTLTADVIGRPWRAERSKIDKDRVIVRRADGAWMVDLDGENAEPLAELIAAAVNAFQPNAPTAKFETQRYGAVVATIQESENGAVEVQARNDGKFILTVHSRVGETDRFEDLSATLDPKHFDMLGSIARQKPVRG